MKKILTASLVAIMAVTAANADIASTKYVDNAKTAALATAATEAQSKADAALASAKAYADDLNTAMDGRVDSLEADNTTNKTDISKLKQDVAGLGTGAGTVASQINNKVGDLGTYGTVVEAIAGAQAAAESTAAADATSKANNALADAKTYADAAEADAVETAGTNADAKINTLKTAMNLAQQGGAGSFVQQVAQANGTVTATATAFIADVATNAESVVAPQTKAIKDYVDGQIEILGDNNSANSDAITQLQADLGDVQTSLQSGATKQAIDAAAALGQQGINNAATAQQTANANKAAIENQTTGLAATKAIADAALPKSEFNSFKTTNTDAINAASAKGQQGITDAAAAKAVADAALPKSEFNTLIGAGANFEIPANCKTANAVCSLVVRAGIAGWEQVVDSATAAE